MEPGSLPKPGEAAKAAFTKLVPDQPNVGLRPMFGNLAAFVNGNLFAGLFGEDLFVRLPADESTAVKEQGGRDFEPMPGRAMKGYVIVPKTWRHKPDASTAMDQESAGADRQDASKGRQSKACREETKPNALALRLALGRRLLLVSVARRSTLTFGLMARHRLRRRCAPWRAEGPSTRCR